MTLRERGIKTVLFLSITAYYLVGYFFLNQWTTHRSDLHTLAFPFETKIPFLPEFMIFYLLIYVFLWAPYLFIDDLPSFKKVVAGFFILVTFHFLCFLGYPVVYTLRPPIDYEWGGIYKLIAFYYWVDLPNNCFPSMHVSNAFFVSLVFLRNRSIWGWIALLGATLVAISVVFVKQHYIVDVFAGIFVAFAVDWFVFRREFSLTRVWPLFRGLRSAP